MKGLLKVEIKILQALTSSLCPAFLDITRQAERTLYSEVFFLLKVCKSNPLTNGLFIQRKALLGSAQEVRCLLLIYTI